MDFVACDSDGVFGHVADSPVQNECSFLSIWRPLLLSAVHSCVSSIFAVLPILAAKERVYFLKLWNNLMRTSKGEAWANLISVAHSLGCDYFSRRLLRYGDRVESPPAALALGHMRDHQSWDLLVTKTLTVDSVKSINAFKAAGTDKRTSNCASIDAFAAGP